MKRPTIYVSRTGYPCCRFPALRNLCAKEIIFHSRSNVGKYSVMRKKEIALTSKRSDLLLAMPSICLSTFSDLLLAMPSICLPTFPSENLEFLFLGWLESPLNARKTQFTNHFPVQRAGIFSIGPYMDQFLGSGFGHWLFPIVKDQSSLMKKLKSFPVLPRPLSLLEWIGLHSWMDGWKATACPEKHYWSQCSCWLIQVFLKKKILPESWWQDMSAVFGTDELLGSWLRSWWWIRLLASLKVERAPWLWVYDQFQIA